jgi:molecular chaperone GrpE
MKEKMKKTPKPTPQPEETNPTETPEIVVEDLSPLVDDLQAKLADTQAKSDEYLDGWQRARAEFANYRKRMERDQALVSQTATGNVIKHFLEVVDDLDRALKNRPTDEEGKNWANGVDLIYRKLLSILETEGVKVIQADGQFFDPNLHEAISNEDHPDLESGQVIATVQQGYMLGERVLRPARVRVTR